MDKTNEGLDEARLKALYKSDHGARRFFDYLSTRSNNQNVSKVERLNSKLEKECPGWKKRDLIRVFRSLDEAGAGRFIVGRHKSPSRFEWDFPMTEVVRIARDGSSSDSEDSSSSNNKRNSAIDTVEHPFNLRADFLVTLKLPTDLKAAEAQRLSEWVRTLPF